MSEVIKVTSEIKLVKYIKGKEYKFTLNVENGTIKINSTRHGGSEEQLSDLLGELAKDFGTTFTVEKHIHSHHTHTHEHDENLETVGE